MKTVKFWEAMKARSEGKWVKPARYSSWCCPDIEYAFGPNDQISDWEIKSEPREFALLRLETGKWEVVPSEINPFNYSYIERIIVREVIE